MMATFTPPTDNFHGLADYDMDTDWSQETRMAYRLFRHYAPLPRGRNVYRLDDGSFVESEPADMDRIAVWYYGGRTYEVFGAEEAALLAAGYEPYMTDLSPVELSPFDSGFDAGFGSMVSPPPVGASGFDSGFTEGFY